VIITAISQIAIAVAMSANSHTPLSQLPLHDVLQTVRIEQLNTDLKLLINLRKEIQRLEQRTDRDFSASIERYKELEPRIIQRIHGICKRANIPVPPEAIRSMGAMN
jgi:hypothetical protein